MNKQFKASLTTQEILEDFVFLDCRLGDHPKLLSTVFWCSGDTLQLVASTPSVGDHPKQNDLESKPGNLAAQIAKDRLCVITSLLGSRFVTRETIQSMIGVPILSGREVLGVVSVSSRERLRFKDKHLGPIQLLAALLGYYVIHVNGGRWTSTPLSVALGQALQNVRSELVLTQQQLADRIGTSRITLSRWESGSQLPTAGPLRRWCVALGLLADSRPSIVTIVDVSPQLLRILKDRPEEMQKLSPSQFERLIADRLTEMGFEVRLTGPTSLKDGGIDLIAVPQAVGVGTFLLAGQVKHHRADRKTGRDAVDRLLSWRNRVFSLGLLVTNTTFTRDALWVAGQNDNRSFLRLRDFEDLKRWLQGEFWSPNEWREIPDEITIAPGVAVRIPKSYLENSLAIWPLTKWTPRSFL